MEHVVIKISFYVEYVSSINNDSLLSKAFGSNKVQNQEGLIAVRTYYIDYNILEKVMKENKILRDNTNEDIYSYMEKASPYEKMNIVNECKLKKDNSVRYTTAYAEWFLTGCQKGNVNPDDWYSAWYAYRLPEKPEIVHKVEIPTSFFVPLRNYYDNPMLCVLNEIERMDNQTFPQLVQYREQVKEQRLKITSIKEDLDNILKSVFQLGSLTYDKFSGTLDEAISAMNDNFVYIDEMERLYSSDEEILIKSYSEIIDSNQTVLNDMELLRKKVIEIKLARKHKTNSDSILKELIQDCESYI